MALPATNTAWPPRPLTPILAAYNEYGAWWAGDTDQLKNIYSAGTHARYGFDTTAARRGTGLMGAAAKFRRLFWGRMATADDTTARGALHVPIAATLATASADLLYSNPPRFTAEDDSHAGTLDRLENYIEDGLHGALLEGAELGAAYSGRYHVVTHVPGLNEGRPFLDTHDPSRVFPEFSWGHLVAANIVNEIERNGGQVLRHVERHELSPDGYGIVLHGLYQGTTDNLGRLIPLIEHPATAPLAEHVNSDGQTTGTPTLGLNIGYIPNMTPQRLWRHIPEGRHLGRSDFEPVIPLMDALDEAWTSWMRDLRLGKARILASRDMLDGVGLDLEREVFTPLENVLPNRNDTALPISQVQFDIRVQEHERTVAAIVEQIVRDAGYSPSTYGEHSGDADITATEVKAREKRTLTTRAKKIRLEKPVLTRLVRKMLLIDQQANPGAGLQPDTVFGLEFEDTVHESMNERAATASLLKTASAASLQTRVEYVHPDWTAEQVEQEAARIRDDENPPLADPSTWLPVSALTSDEDDAE